MTMLLRFISRFRGRLEKRAVIWLIGPIIALLFVAIPSLQAKEPALIGETQEFAVFLPIIQEPFFVWLPLIGKPPITITGWPENGATKQSVNLYLAWEVDPQYSVGAVTYEIFLSAGRNEPDQLIASTDQTFWEPPRLELGTQYSWQVVLTNANGRFDGPIWTFTTESPADSPEVGTTVYVPPGEFRMGCDASNPAEMSCLHKETPLHPVYLDGYHIDKYEVTNGEYRACVNAGACNLPRLFDSYTRDSYFDNPEYDLFPVLYVSWWDAQDYCRWAGKRLPTEAEWEKAARGMASTRVWPWGNDSPTCTLLNYTNNAVDPWQPCVGDTVQVGSYPLGASPYGAYDMGGNVFEWVADKHDVTYYSYSPYYNPQGNQTIADLFTIRGGSYRPNWYYARVAHRHWGHRGDRALLTDDAPYYRNNQVGFRCAVSAP